MIKLKTALNSKTVSKWLSDESLSKKASLNALAAVLDYGARLAVAFIINPLLVAGLGDYFYGVWQISARLAGYLSIAGGRPTQALKWTVAHQQTSTDFEKKRQNVGSAVAVWFLFVPLMALLGAGLVWVAPTLLKTPPAYVGVVRVAIGLLVLNLLIMDLADVPQSVVRGENLGYKRLGLSTVLLLLGGGLTAFALYAGMGLTGVAAVELAMTVLTGVFFLQVARMYVPWFGIIRPALRTVRQFLSLSWWFILWRVVQQALIASDIVLLGLLNSVEIVAVYSLTKFVPDALANFLVTIVGGIAPGLGSVIGKGDLQRAARVRGLIITLTWLLATVAGATTLLWSETFITLWVGQKYYAGSTQTLLIMLVVIQLALIRNDANLINLTLDLPSKVLIGIISVTLSLALAGILISFYNLGIIGLCLGFIVGRSILSLGYPLYLSRFFQTPFPSQLKSAVRPALVTLILYGLMLSINGVFRVDTWIGLLFGAAMTAAVVSVAAAYGGLSRKQRDDLWQRVRLSIPSNKRA
jgi:O-antigen/teichoic acid export membrane protein